MGQDTEFFIEAEAKALADFGYKVTPNDVKVSLDFIIAGNEPRTIVERFIKRHWDKYQEDK